MKELAIISYNFLLHLLKCWAVSRPGSPVCKEHDWRGRCRGNSQMHSCALLKPPEPSRPGWGRELSPEWVCGFYLKRQRYFTHTEGRICKCLVGVLATRVPSISMGLKQPNLRELWWKCTPEGPTHSGRNKTSRLYPQDFCSRDPWRVQNTLCGSLNPLTGHQRGKQLGNGWCSPVLAWGCCGEQFFLHLNIVLRFFFPL